MQRDTHVLAVDSRDHAQDAPGLSPDFDSGRYVFHSGIIQRIVGVVKYTPVDRSSQHAFLHRHKRDESHNDQGEH
jgi:hypothetical protein